MELLLGPNQRTGRTQKVASYVLQEYKKGRDLVTIIKEIEEVDTSKWKAAAPTSTEGKISESEMMEYKLL